MADRFIKVDRTGALLLKEAPDPWEAVLDTKTNLMWSVEVLKRQTYAKALKAPEKLKTAGFGDWRLPTVEELFLLADRTRVSPAINTDYFPDTPSDWFWTSTPYASSPSDCAWVVDFYDGNSSWGFQGSVSCVRAVRAGQ